MPRLKVRTGSNERASRPTRSRPASTRSRGVGEPVEVGVELEVLAGRQVEVDQRVVAQVADLAPRGAGPVGQGVAADRQLARLGAQQRRDHAEQRALAGAVRPEHGQALAGREVHVDPVHRPALAEALHEAARADELPRPYSVTSASVKTRKTTASSPFDWAKAAWTRVVSPGRTMAFS